MGAKVIAVANQKGGVAKTTTTYNLAAAKAKAGKRVLMIDLDPQASLTIAAGIEPGTGEAAEKTICDLFNSKINPAECCITADAANNIIGKDLLYIIPSSIDLAVVERNLAASRNSDVQLRKAVKRLADYFDYIFIDCPPQLGTLLTNALTAADEVIIPVKTDYLAYRGLTALIETITDIKAGDGDRSLNPDLQITGIVATMYKSSSNDNKDILELLRSRYEVLGVIKDTVSVNKNVIDGVPAVLAPKLSNVAKSYLEIANII